MKNATLAPLGNAEVLVLGEKDSPIEDNPNTQVPANRLDSPEASDID